MLLEAFSPFLFFQKEGDVMTDEARELHNQYQREYRKAHPEKVRQYRETYWMRRAAKAEQEQQPQPEQNQTRKDD